MRLERLQLHGFSSAFPGVVDLPLREIAPGLIALTGANGAGKTTLLESTPGVIFRRLPARDGDDPVRYATGRDSFIDLEYSVEGRGAFHIRLNLDGPKRQTDALLEAVLADGSRVPLNNGQRSTFDEQIRSRFPSFDLFINSSFVAQGRGDEFTRRKPSQRKDVLVEILALSHYAGMAKTASEAADLLADARLRLEVQIEQLARDTDAALMDALDRQANELQTRGGQAEVRQRELRTSLAELEERSALLADQVAAYSAATQRVRTLDADVASRQGELTALARQRSAALKACLDEQVQVIATRDADLKDIDSRIAGNEQLRAQGTDIRAAVVALATIDGQLVEARRQLETCQATQQRALADLRGAEQALAALVPVEQQHTRAKADAGLLASVPCGGAEPYATCQFLVNATAAQARIAELETRLLPKALLADQVGTLIRAGEAHVTAIASAKRRIATLETDRARHQKQAAYDAPLAAADARITELTEQRAKVTSDADARRQAADRRRTDRVAELDDQERSLNVTIGRLEAARATAGADLDVATSGNTRAVELQATLSAARADWDTVTATIATVASVRQELEQRRAALVAKRTTLGDLRQRFTRIDTELLEWRDLAKALGKGGLPDLEIDAAGPEISATTTALLLASYGPRFSLELVTQVAKSDGSGMKDLFTVEVTDNEAGGATRDISQLSGGEKTIVQEALMSAISLYVNARSPMPIRTLWRDETGAALDPANAVRYVAMLRRVAEIGQYVHVFFITHNAEAAALADAQIHVAAGTATIVYPPYVEAAA